VTDAEITLAVSGMDCASCVSHVEKAASRLPGVNSCRVNLATGRAVVRFDSQSVSAEQVAQAITSAGYGATPQTSELAVRSTREDARHAAARAWLARAIVGVILWLPVELTHWILHARGLMPVWLDWTAFVTSTVALIYVGWGFYSSALRALLHLTVNMDTLIAIGATVAWLYSLVAFAGWQLGYFGRPAALYFMESSGLLALISLGHWLEAEARDSAGSAIRQLLDLSPATALLLDDAGQTREVPLDQLHVGDRFLVRPGDRIGVDGIVLEGSSGVDESMMTGEPLPKLRTAGNEVIGGTQNVDGRLVVRATKVGRDTALAQIIDLVDNAQSSKPPVQQLADRIAAVFVPVVLLIALLTAVGWLIAGRAAGRGESAAWAAAANASCSVLIIACPCALGLALPAAVMVCTGRGAKRGILFRDIDAVQRAGAIRVALLDKTGTLTHGKPTLSRICPGPDIDENALLRLAAAAEQYSEHPLAKSIVATAVQRGIDMPDLESFSNEGGLGVVVRVNGRDLLVGNSALLAKYNAPAPEQASGYSGSTVLVAEKRSADGPWRSLGAIELTDQIRDEAASVVAALRDMGIRAVLLTGDSAAAASAVATAVGITDVRADVRPQQKAEVVRSAQADGGHVAMIGDGINDAPALAAADLGIAIGTGSDIAKEAGGIVLVGGLGALPAAIRLSRRTMRTIHQNFFFAFLYNVLAIPLAAAGMLNPLIAAAAMALSDLTVLGNALRLRRGEID
jgi:Cu+-exporting ATPase